MKDRRAPISRCLAALLAAACAPVPSPTSPASGTPPVLSYVHGFDPLRHAATCKVYHHVHAPDGRLLTKGDGGTFPHHRGVFFGTSQLRVEGVGWFDFWHCGDGEAIVHRRFVPAEETGREASWQTAELSWLTASGREVLRERRSWRQRRDGEVAIVDFELELQATAAAVRFGGDPHHAGFHCRALEAFAADGAEPVRFVLPPGTVAFGDDIHGQCPWLAGILPLPDGEVTVLLCDDPANPKPSRASARAYGRFGFAAGFDLVAGQSRALRYRLVVAGGARDAGFCAQAAR